MKYKINEIFHSIQGEGYYTGTPVIFIRFSGCNLKCYFCDTQHEAGSEWTTGEIVRELLKYPCYHVVLTGGEPTLQPLTELTAELKKRGYYIQIETNGTTEIINGVDWITCSPKKDFKLIRGNELKVVYTGQPLDCYLEERFDHFYLQPCSEENTEEVIRIVKSNPRWTLSVQMQKLLKIR